MKAGEEKLDTNGNEIKVGSRVVYNQSGNLVDGVVTMINPRKTPLWMQAKGLQYYIFTIKKLKGGEYSKVKMGSSIYVL